MEDSILFFWFFRETLRELVSVTKKLFFFWGGDRSHESSKAVSWSVG